METIRKDYDEAEQLYKKALALDPADQWLQELFAEFQEKHRS